MSFYAKYFRAVNEKITSINESILDEIVERIILTNNQNRKVIVVGNGGSAAIAGHVALDLTKSAGIRSVTFNQADVLTCFSNDYGYENWISRALEHYADKDDLVILISSSGASKNILNGAETAKKLGLRIITLSGFNNNNPLRQMGDINLFVDSKLYNVVEITHQIWLLAISDKIINNKENERD